MNTRRPFDWKTSFSLIVEFLMKEKWSIMAQKVEPRAHSSSLDTYWNLIRNYLHQICHWCILLCSPLLRWDLAQIYLEQFNSLILLSVQSHLFSHNMITYCNIHSWINFEHVAWPGCAINWKIGHQANALRRKTATLRSIVFWWH